MSSFSDEIGLDLQEAIAEIGDQTTFEYRGQEIPCVRHDEKNSEIIVEGGVILKVDYSVIVTWIDLAAAAVSNPRIGEGIDGNAAQIKHLVPGHATLLIYAGSFDE
jgi:hypothetical protein